MDYKVTSESFDSLASLRRESTDCLAWDLPFMLPEWMSVWQLELGTESELYLRAVRQGETVIGIAPLLVQDRTASFIGSADVCDYLDFIIVPGREEEFFDIMLSDLRERGVCHLDLRALRPDSLAVTHLMAIARDRQYQYDCQPDDVSLEMDLPSTWDDYLSTLDKKQRHEVRRKLRRLSEAGKVEYRLEKDSAVIGNSIDDFLRMFTDSRQDKAEFLTKRMEAFFRSLASTLIKAGILRLGILELDRLSVAMIICFDYNNCLYLYNSGFDPKYDSLSVGLLSKVLTIKGSIEEGKERFDFLKGNENYKHHLGGQVVSLSRCQIMISQ